MKILFLMLFPATHFSETDFEWMVVADLWRKVRENDHSFNNVPSFVIQSNMMFFVAITLSQFHGIW